MKLFTAFFVVLAVAASLRIAHGRTLASVQNALLALPTFTEDRAPEFAEARARLVREVAEAVARHAVHKDGSPHRTLAALTIATMHHESGLSLRIVGGKCLPHECDRGKARGLAQLQRNGMPDADWDRMHGLGNIDAQVAEAVRRIRGMLGMCRSVEGAARALTGRGCSAKLPGVERRMRTFAMVEARLR